MAFLFTLMDDEQPVNEIKNIMSRWENGTIDQIIVIDGGSGYIGSPPNVCHTHTHTHTLKHTHRHT